MCLLTHVNVKNQISPQYACYQNKALVKNDFRSDSEIVVHFIDSVFVATDGH